MNDVVVSRYQYYGYDSDRSSVQRVVISSWREKRVIVCIVLYAGERSRQSQTMYSELAVGSEVAWWPQTPPIGNLLVGWDGIHCFIFQLAKLCQNFSRARGEGFFSCWIGSRLQSQCTYSSVGYHTITYQAMRA